MGQEKKILSPMRNWTSDLRIPRSDAQPLSHKDSMVRKTHYKVHIWHTSCILLRSARSILSCFVNRIRKMASFELGKEIEKDVFLRLLMSVGQRKNPESLCYWHCNRLPLPSYDNPFIPWSDSKYLQSNLKVTTIKKMVTHSGSSWSSNKFSLSVVEET